MSRVTLLVACAVGQFLLAGLTSPCSAADSGWPAEVDSVQLTRERLRPVMKGTEAPIRMWKSTYADYALEFQRCFVRVTDNRDAVGESLRVTLKRAISDTTWREDGRVDVMIAEEDGFLFGVEKDYLFIDTGCCPGPRGLLVYDLAKGLRILDATYVGYPLDPVVRGGRWLTFLEAVENPSPLAECPDAAQWETEGWGIGFEEEVWFDLRTRRTTRSGIVTCSTRQ